MTGFKKERVSEILRKLAADFIKENAGTNSLITATQVHFNERAGKASIFFTAYPEDKEEEALAFLKRKRSDFRKFVKDHSKIGRVPFFDFRIDRGEKNRQTIEKLSEKE